MKKTNMPNAPRRIAKRRWRILIWPRLAAALAFIFIVSHACLEAKADDAAEDKVGLRFLLREVEVTVKSNGEITKRIRSRLQVLDKNSVETAGEVSIPFNSFRHNIKFIQAKTIAPDGREYKVKSGSVRTMLTPQANNFNIYSDAMELSFSMPAVTVGSIIDYEVEKSTRNPVIPGHAWDGFIFEAFIPVDEAVYSVLHPKSMNINFMVEGDVVDSEVERYWFNIRRTWRLRDLPAVKYEHAMPPYGDMQRTVRWTTLEDWKTVQDWYGELTRDIRNPSQAIREKVMELVAGLESRDEIIRALYGYIQKEFRYVGIALGHSAYKPHQAGECFENKYGDCKDKANLLVSMLAEAGVDSYLALVRGVGDGKFLENLPSPEQFNHAIVYVPGDPKPLWLDCTVKFYDEASHPPELDTAMALIIGHPELQILQIQPPRPEEVVFRQIYEIDLHHDGFSRIMDIDEYVGRSGAAGRMNQTLASPAEKEETILEYASQRWDGMHVLSHGSSDPYDLSNPFRIWLEFEGDGFFNVTGSGLNSRLTVDSVAEYISLLPEWAQQNEKLMKGKRTSPWVRKSVAAHELVLRVKLPPGMRLAERPSTYHAELPEGTLKIEVEERDGVVTAVCGAYQKPCVIPPEFFAANLTANRQSIQRGVRNILLVSEPSRLLAEHKPFEAVKLAEQLVQENPDSAAAFSMAARIYQACGRVHSARRALRKALRLDPGQVKYYMALAETFMGLNKDFDNYYARDKAIAIMRDALVEVRDWRAAAKFLALCLEHDDRGQHRSGKISLDEAIAMRELILERHEDDAEEMEAIGECHFTAGRHDKGAEWFRKAYEAQNLDPGMSPGAIVCGAFMGGIEEAIAAVNAGGAPPQDQEAELGRIAGLLMRYHKYAEAARLLEAAIETKHEQDALALILREVMSKLAEQGLRGEDSPNDLTTPLGATRAIMAATFHSNPEILARHLSGRLSLKIENIILINEETMRQIIAHGGGGEAVAYLGLDILSVAFNWEETEIMPGLVMVQSYPVPRYRAFNNQSPSLAFLLLKEEAEWKMLSMGDKIPAAELLALGADSFMREGNEEYANALVELIVKNISDRRGLAQDESVPSLLSVQKFPSSELRNMAFIGFHLGSEWNEVAIDYLLKALDEMPDNNAVRHALAGKYAQAGRFNEAANQYHQLVEATPENRMLVFKLLATLKEAGRHVEAWTAKDRLAELIPSSDFIKKIKFDLHVARGEFKEAQSILLSAGNPFKGEDYWRQAIFLHGLMRNGEALSEISAKMVVNIQNNLPLINRVGMGFYMLGEYDKALNEYERVIAHGSTDEVIRANQIVALASMGKINEAEAIYRQMTRGLPGGTNSRTIYGNLAIMLGDYGKAAEFHRVVAANENGRQRAYSHLFEGIALLRGGRPQEAAEAFQKPLSELGDGDWPRPHLLFLTGQINLGELLDIASKTESVLESMHQKCEAFYYAAMLQFAARNAWMGQYYLRSAIEMKRPESWQYRMALGELMRIEWGAKKTSF